MTEAIITAVLLGLATLLGGAAGAYKVFGETNRANKDAEAKRERDQQEAIQNAFKVVTDSLQIQLTNALNRVSKLELGREERDTQIQKLQDAQRESDKRQAESDKKQADMQKELDTLRVENQQKDKQIKEQDAQISTLKQENTALKTRQGQLEGELETIRAYLREQGIAFPDGEKVKKESGGSE